jgi:hypothetical protein
MFPFQLESLGLLKAKVTRTSRNGLVANVGLI